MKSTPKIKGYLAESKNADVFLYRQSNQVTYLISFNYQNKKDKLTVGSRFYGRIYPNRCDLSPDGKDFIYFAMGRDQKQCDKNYYSWSAMEDF